MDLINNKCNFCKLFKYRLKKSLKENKSRNLTQVKIVCKVANEPTCEMAWKKVSEGTTQRSGLPANCVVTYDDKTGFCILEVNQVKPEDAGDRYAFLFVDDILIMVITTYLIF